MVFRTEITIPRASFSISHANKIEMIGSCFVENISAKLKQAGFRIDVNPFGILYNPVSIGNAFADLLQRKEFTEDDIFLADGIYRSFSHHGRFSGVEPTQVLETMNLQLAASQRFLKEASILIITFGTAKVYRLLSTGEVVANCHKLPANRFSHELLSVDAIVEQWLYRIEQLKRLNPGIKILFTVSPIRHWKDGAHDNQVSKSVLFVALNEILRQTENTFYFPSYELMLDDLRDYRFYAEDMIHPNAQAINYIWEKFGNTYFDDKTKEVIKELESIRQALNHRPFNPDSDEYKNFLKAALQRKEAFSRQHPEVDVSELRMKNEEFLSCH